MTAKENTENTPQINPWLTTIAVMSATFIFVLDGTIANVALPQMAGSFSSSNDEATWILTSYLIASGIVVPSVDWFSKFFGRKAFFIACILLFTVASLLCGMSTSLDMMIFARILQGLGGGALLPVSQAILLEAFPLEKRALAMSIFGFGVVVAPVIGPILGGWLTDNWSWNWIFFINIPFGILAAVTSKLWIFDPPYARKQAGAKIDYIGFAFLIVWLVTFQVFLDKGNNADWFGSEWICWTFGISMVAMVLFIYSQIVQKNSIIDLKVFKDRNFLIGTTILVIANMVLYASTTIMPLFLQNLMGYNAFWSGYSLMPRGFGSVAAIFLYSVMNKVLDFRIFTAIGITLLGISGLMFGHLNLEFSMINIVIPNVIFGFSVGLTITVLTTASMETISNAQMTNASGVQNLIKNLGAAIGTSLVATMVSRYSQAFQHNMVGFLDNASTVYAEKLASLTSYFAQFDVYAVALQKAQGMLYNQLIQQSTLCAYIETFRVWGIITFICLPLLLLYKQKLRKPAPEEIALPEKTDSSDY